jgi:hypothetical protein
VLDTAFEVLLYKDITIGPEPRQVFRNLHGGVRWQMVHEKGDFTGGDGGVCRGRTSLKAYSHDAIAA